MESSLEILSISFKKKNVFFPFYKSTSHTKSWYREVLWYCVVWVSSVQATCSIRLKIMDSFNMEIIEMVWLLLWRCGCCVELVVINVKVWLRADVKVWLLCWDGCAQIVVTIVVIVMCAGYLYHLTLKIVDSLNIEELRTKKQDLLKQLTKPLTKRIVQVSCGQNTQCLKSCSLWGLS